MGGVGRLSGYSSIVGRVIGSLKDRLKHLCAFLLVLILQLKKMARCLAQSGASSREAVKISGRSRIMSAFIP
ncbi:MAG: hypothetical protein L0Y38_05350, partial [Methylococcaceae bacterium]|nr:hypothetical protein [Methylococcaceae bacterium]